MVSTSFRMMRAGAQKRPRGIRLRPDDPASQPNNARERSVSASYHEGKLVETLVAGRHVRWGKNFRVALVDTRKTLLQVAGQEVLSANNVGVKLSVVLATQNVDAAKTARSRDRSALRNLQIGRSKLSFSHPNADHTPKIQGSSRGGDGGQFAL
jgi:hypothetical protein